jgi:tetratricopeptide (TPR) repeat protein
VFFEATVREYLDRIEDKDARETLKMRYFASRVNHPYDRLDGYNLLLAEIKKEKPGSRRWFALGNAAGYAALRIPDAPMGDGYRIYAGIFDKTPEALAAGAGAETAEAITDYCSLVQIPRVQHAQGFYSYARWALLKALDAHLILLARGQVPDADWSGAVPATDAQEEAPKHVEAALQKAGEHPSFELLVTAGLVETPGQPGRSIELLQKARAIAPAASPMLPELYGRLPALLEQQNRPDEALAVQQWVVEKTGRGWGRLAMLQYEKGQVDAFRKCLQQAGQAGDAEVQDTVTRILALRSEHEKDTALRDGLKNLLETYVPRAKDTGVELFCRVTLAQIRQEMGDRAGALKALEGAPEEVTGLTARVYLDALKAMKKKLQETGATTPDGGPAR